MNHTDGSAPTPESLHALSWAEEQMPLLTSLRHDAGGCLTGHRIVMRGHITKESTVQARTLNAFGAEVAWCASSAVTTDPNMVTIMADEGVHFPPPQPDTERAGADAIHDVLTHFAEGPTLILDEGGDLLRAAHDTEHPTPHVRGGVEKTGSGMVRLRASISHSLAFPVMAVDSAYLKHVVDNSGGAPQSVLECIIRSSRQLLAGRTLMIVGFGGVGDGLARRARGMGCRVIVTEVRPTRALRALVEGFEVMRIDEALEVADVVCTATGEQALTEAHLSHMRSGVVLANAGHFNDELPVRALREHAVRIREMHPGHTQYTLPDGRTVTLLGNGDMINLAVGEGNPGEVMDITFATQIAALRFLCSQRGPCDPGVYPLPSEVEEELARHKLNLMGLALQRT